MEDEYRKSIGEDSCECDSTAAAENSYHHANEEKGSYA
jgi:hypothetical protein